MTAMSRRGANAFTLIELATASFLIGVALLALAAMLSAANRATSDAENAFRAKEFAENSLATLRIKSDRAAADGRWLEFWETLRNGQTNILADQLASFRAGVWQYGEDAPELSLDGELHTNFWLRADNDGAPDSSIRYRFIVRPNGNGDAADGSEVYFYTVNLHVWNGLSTSQDADYSYFAIFADPGDLP